MMRRIDALRALLDEKGLEAFVSVSPATNAYLASFEGTASGVLITHDIALFLCDFRYTEQASVQVKDHTIEEVSGEIPPALGARLKALGIKNAAFEPQYTSVAERLSIEEAYGAELIPDRELAALLRQTKDEEEIELIRAASELAEGVLADLLDTLEPGVTEREVAAQFEFEFKNRGASGASFDTIALFGARSSLPHGQPAGKPLERGDTVLLDFGCRKSGYCSDLTRTFAFGTISGAWFEEIYELTLTAQRMALEAARPGMTARELDAIARTLIADAGYGPRFGHGLGHGLGVEIHEAPRLNPRTDTVLRPGMVVTVEPGIYLPGQGGVRIEDLAVITGDGCEILSSAPKELRILGE